MVIGVLKEENGDQRVSLLPEAVATLTKKGIHVWVEDSAGVNAFASNADYEKAGAQIKEGTAIASGADVILSINQPEQTFSKPHIRIGVYQPLYYQERMQQWAAQNI